MTWCYKTDCEYCSKHGHRDYFKDGDGRFGECKLEEIIIDRNGRCKSEKEITKPDPADVAREAAIYKDEVKLAGGKVE